MSQRILVIDDEPAVCRHLHDYFVEHGFEVIAVSSAREALGLLDSFHPDLLVVDWMLKDSLDGLQIAAAFRGRNPQLRTLVISGYPSAELEQRVQALQATRFLCKPFAFTELQRAIEPLLASLDLADR